MAKSENQKSKILVLLQILQEKTDENHKMNAAQLINELEKRGIHAERKSIYDDVARLQEAGFDIINVKSKKDGGYYLGVREFELAELKLLVDAVASSKFVTLKKSRELIKKLEKLASHYEARELEREVFVSNRVKSDNESVYYTIDAIHSAIYGKFQLEYQYCEWNREKELVPRKSGRPYRVTPVALVWSEERYYLVAFDENDDCIKHFRVDKIKNITELETKASKNDMIKEFDLASFANKTFGMYGGKEDSVTMVFPDSLAGVVIDRFGKELVFREEREDRFIVRVKVAVSNQFFGWITGLGSEVLILGPEYVVKQYKDYLSRIIQNY